RRRHERVGDRLAGRIDARALDRPRLGLDDDLHARRLRRVDGDALALLRVVVAARLAQLVAPLAAMRRHAVVAGAVALEREAAVVVGAYARAAPEPAAAGVERARLDVHAR